MSWTYTDIHIHNVWDDSWICLTLCECFDLGSKDTSPRKPKIMSYPQTDIVENIRAFVNRMVYISMVGVFSFCCQDMFPPLRGHIQKDLTESGVNKWKKNRKQHCQTP